jgi:N-acetyl-1-D-myo-inositol-2-amino-2-deoxy-alpha-D-glucopyranoside deacetylase
VPSDLGLLCVHAHPDDETIMTGGVLARAADEGLRTAVVTCTGGERGEVVGAGMDPAEVAPRLAEVRAAELEAALAVLGTTASYLLGYVDSGMVGTEGNDDPASFWQADVDEAVGRLVAVLREFRPDVVVVYDAFGGYGHPDHVQAHRVGTLAVEAAGMAASYPAAGPAWRVRKLYQATLSKSRIVQINRGMVELGLPSPFGEADRPEDVAMGMPDELVRTVVDVRPWLERKMRALVQHASQLSPDSLFLNTPEHLVGQAFGVEEFVRQRSDVPVPDGVEDDLFAGLR